MEKPTRLSTHGDTRSFSDDEAEGSFGDHLPARTPVFRGTLNKENDALRQTLHIFFTERASFTDKRSFMAHRLFCAAQQRVAITEKTKPFQPIVLSSICRSISAGEGMAVHVRGSIPRRSTIKEDLDARFRASLVAYFLRRTGSPQEAEDLTQETFVRLIGSNTFEDAEAPHAFVFRVASNLLRDRARSTTRLQRFPPLSIDALPNPDFEPKLVEGLDPERVLIARENLSEVLACLDELGERTKSIFILFRLEGMKQKGIAAIYGISHSTVEKHVMAAVLHLAKRFRTIR